MKSTKKNLIVTENKLNKIIIISSPSGAGKTTICKYLLKKFKNIELSTSYTTRKKRNIETDGLDYHFIDEKKFFEFKIKNYFIETAKVFNNYYGSPISNINKVFKKNKHILFDIDWQGARKLRRNFNKNQIIDFFILPPSKIELKKRLKKRGRDNLLEIKIRLSHAISEMNHHTEYKYVLINDNINETVENLIKIINYNLLIDKLNLQKNKNLNLIK